MSAEAEIKPFASSGVAWTQWMDLPRFALRYRHLSRAALGEHYRVGVAIEELMPGAQTAPAHYHIFEEEHVFMLEGEVTARIGAERFPMRAGDYVCFPAGRKAGHCLVNTSGKVARYVIVGERNPNEVVVYTDSRKVLVRALGPCAIFDMGGLMGYFEREETGLPGGVQVPFELPSIEAETAAFAPIASGDVEWQEEGEGPKFGGRSRHLTHAVAGENYRVGVLIEAPSPGMRLAPRHYHMLEEEHVLVLEGELTLLLGEAEYSMRAGDYVCFPAGLKTPHSMLNSGDGPCSYLMIGERNPAEVCVYPDSNKLMVRALRSDDDIFDMSAVRAYWDGE